MHFAIITLHGQNGIMESEILALGVYLKSLCALCADKLLLKCYFARFLSFLHDIVNKIKISLAKLPKIQMRFALRNLEH